MRTIAIINLKGGVAKTTSSINIAYILTTRILASIRIPPRQIPLTRQNIRGVRLRARRELMENREEPTSLSRLVTC